MRLVEYSSLEEKRLAFANDKCEDICTPKKFDDWYNSQSQLTTNIHPVYRGVNEARYKLYTSFQRLWASQKLDRTGVTYHDSINQLLKIAKKKDSALAKYIKALGVESNDWLILAFLQHYGAATPLLDFSKSLDVALFFACCDVKYDAFSDDDSINNYISVYSAKIVDAGQKIKTLPNIASSLAQNVSQDNTSLLKANLSFNKVTQGKDIVIVPAYTNPITITNSQKEIVMQLPVGNMNSVVQNGEFICNINELEPLENVFRSDPHDVNTSYLSCVNIHKGLVDYITEKHLGGSLESAKKKYYVKEEDVAQQIQFSLTSMKTGD